MEWIKVEDSLPCIGANVLGFGIYEWDDIEDGGKVYIHHTEPSVEIGFRSEVDDPNKPYEWADFSFKVTHWFYLEGPGGEKIE